MGEKPGAEADDIVIIEVMAGEFDRAWWQDFRASLERRFDQDTVIIRVSRIETI